MTRFGFIDQYRENPAYEHNAVLAQSAASRAEHAVQRLEDLMARHALVLKALLTFCERKGMFKEPEFMKIMEEIDLSDGTRDGKYKPGVQPRSCVACGRNNQRTAVRCMYCGEEIKDRDPL